MRKTTCPCQLLRSVLFRGEWASVIAMRQHHGWVVVAKSCCYDTPQCLWTVAVGMHLSAVTTSWQWLSVT